MRPTQLLYSRILTRDIATSARQCRLRASISIPLTTTHATKPSSSSSNLRTFTSTPIPLKKGGKAAREEKKATPSSSSSSPSATEDPYDFSSLDSEIETAVEKLKNELSQLRQGGRFNPAVLEALRVQIKGAGDAGTKMEKLGDLAQVVPKGRVVHVVVGEQEHLKPISSSIQSSNLSLTPQPDPTGQSPLTLHIPIPPPTAESRKAVVNSASKAGDVANNAIRNARQVQQKKLRAMQLNKTVRPDDFKKATAQMEKVVEKGGAEVKRIVDAAKKALDS